MAEKTKRRRALALLCLLCLGAGSRIWLSAQLPDTFTLAQGEDLVVADMPFLEVKDDKNEVPVASLCAGSSCNVQLSLLGILPVKTVRASVQNRRTVTACGWAFGLKMFSAGVMIVSFSDIYTEAGYQNPAKKAGLQLGDYLVSINGTAVKSNDQMKQLVTAAAGAPLSVTYTREGKSRVCTVTPVKDALSGSWRMGVWVRDSSAGIGTLTYYDKTTGVFAGLGHSVTDADTGESLTLSRGEIVPVNITGALAGVSGVPGELRGNFASGNQALGSIRLNGQTGLYGILYDQPAQGIEMETAQMQEIQTGPAKIIATIDDNGPQTYDITIERLAYSAADPNRNMLIRVTDKNLLAATGGIVQGMSGSPIIQNGRLVGAVTHVLVKDPTRGYGIFVENMLKTSDSIENVKNKKVA